MTQQQYGQPPYQQYAPPPVQTPSAPQGYATYPPQPDPYAQPAYNPNMPHNPGAYGQQPYPPQGYGQVPPPPVQAPQGPPLPQGTLDDFYNQRSVGSGKGLSWNGKPDGYRYIGVVTKTPSNSDVFVDTQPAAQGGAPKQNRDGSFKYVLQVQLRIAWLDQFQQFTYADQDARLFLRGGLRDETTRAMHEVGAEGVPQEGALIDVTLTGRKPGNNIATNVFAVVYRPAGTWENDPQYAPFVPQLLGGQAPAPQQNQAPQNQAPYQQQATAQYAAPAQAAPNPQQYAQQGPPAYVGQAQQAYDPNQYAQQQYGQQAYDPNQQQAYPQAAQDQGTQQPQGQPVNPSQGQAPGGYADPNQPSPNGQQQQLPYGAPQGGPAPAPGTGQMPAGAPAPQPGTSGSGLDPARQQLLARITNQQQPQQG